MHGPVIAGVVVMDIRILSFGHYRGLHCQARGMVILIPCADPLHCRDEEKHDEDAEHQEKDYLKYTESKAKSHSCPSLSAIKDGLSYNFTVFLLACPSTSDCGGKILPQSEVYKGLLFGQVPHGSLQHQLFGANIVEGYFDQRVAAHGAHRQHQSVAKGGMRHTLAGFQLQQRPALPL